MKANELILYKNMQDEQILKDMVFLMEEYKSDYYNREDILALLSEVTGDILELSVNHGFEGNLWQDYLTYLLVISENGYSTSCEITGKTEGSHSCAALHDFRIFRELFQYDFREMEEELAQIF